MVKMAVNRGILPLLVVGSVLCVSLVVGGAPAGATGLIPSVQPDDPLPAGMVGCDVWIVKNVVRSRVPAPGDPVTFTLTLGNEEDALAAGVVVTDELSISIGSAGWGLSANLVGTTAMSRTRFVWALPDLAPGASGVITTYGVFSESLPSAFQIENAALIATGELEADLADGPSTVTVGTRSKWLPPVTSHWPPVPDTPTLLAIANDDLDGDFSVNWNAADFAESCVLEEDTSPSCASPAVRYSDLGLSWSAVGKSGVACHTPRRRTSGRSRALRATTVVRS
jgi:uncharacterized repeat protein (TIGR01451 family)